MQAVESRNMFSVNRELQNWLANAPLGLYLAPYINFRPVVLAPRTPFQIVSAVIYPVAVNMIHFVLELVPVSAKCIRNKPMDIGIFCLALAIKMDLEISVAGIVDRQDFLADKALDPAEAGHLINSFIARHVAPFFDAHAAAPS